MMRPENPCRRSPCKTKPPPMRVPSGFAPTMATLRGSKAAVKSIGSMLKSLEERIVPLFETDRARRPVSLHDHRLIVELEEFCLDALQDIAIGRVISKRAADAPGEERIAGENRRSENITGR